LGKYKNVSKMAIAEERKLIEGCLIGDKDSWDNFVKTYTKLVYSFIYRTLELKGYKIESDIVSDLHQELFLSLLQDNFRRLRTFRWERNCSLATWIGVVTRNLVLNFIKSSSRKNSVTESIDASLDEDGECSLMDRLSDDAPSIKETIDKKTIMSLLCKYLEKLDINERTILDMFYLQKLPLEEIARVLNKSEDAVFMQKKRIIASIEERFKKNVGF